MGYRPDRVGSCPSPGLGHTQTEFGSWVMTNASPTKANFKGKQLNGAIDCALVSVGGVNSFLHSGTLKFSGIGEGEGFAFGKRFEGVNLTEVDRQAPVLVNVAGHGTFVHTGFCAVWPAIMSMDAKVARTTLGASGQDVSGWTSKSGKIWPVKFIGTNPISTFQSVSFKDTVLIQPPEADEAKALVFIVVGQSAGASLRVVHATLQASAWISDFEMHDPVR